MAVAPIITHKKLRKNINIEGKEFVLEVRYTNHPHTPYAADLNSLDGTFFRHRFTKELSDVPTMLVELKNEAAQEIKHKTDITSNIDKLTKYFDEL